MLQKNRVLGHMRWSGIMAAVMAGISLLLYGLLRFLPDLARHTYIPFSRFISGLLGMAFGFVATSAAELIAALLILIMLIYFIVVIARSIHHKHAWGLLRWLYDMVLCVYCIAFLFFFLWGGNYLADTLDKRLGLEVREHSEAALEATTRHILNQVIVTAPLVQRNGSGITVSEGGFDAMAEATVESMKSLLLQYPELFGNAFIAKPKPILLSYPMGFTGITGIYIPLTGEANVNTYVTDAFMPATMAHEMAHRLGCSSEADANFLAYLACIDSEDPMVRYSGALFAFSYCRSAILDGDLQRELWDALPAGAQKDYHHSSEVHNQFSGPVMEASAAINDGYIRAMGQSDGLRSYGRIVDLLIASYVSDYGDPDAY